MTTMTSLKSRTHPPLFSLSWRLSRRTAYGHLLYLQEKSRQYHQPQDLQYLQYRLYPINDLTTSLILLSVTMRKTPGQLQKPHACRRFQRIPSFHRREYSIQLQTVINLHFHLQCHDQITISTGTLHENQCFSIAWSSFQRGVWESSEQV
jgi:hypothetical protein